MESIKQLWTDTMQIPGAGWVIGIAGLIISLLIAFYVVKLFRDMALGNTDQPSSYLTDFRQLRDEGKLEPEEYERLSKAIPRESNAKDEEPPSSNQ